MLLYLDVVIYIHTPISGSSMGALYIKCHLSLIILLFAQVVFMEAVLESMDVDVVHVHIPIHTITIIVLLLHMTAAHMCKHQ